MISLRARRGSSDGIVVWGRFGLIEEIVERS